MKKIFAGCFVSFGLLFITFSIHAQDGVIQNLQKESATATKKAALPSDTNHLWQKGLLYNLNFSQSSLTNWSAGGDKFSMSINSILNIFAKYAHGKNSWDNTFDFNLGYVNSTSLGARKNDDRFDLVSKYGRSINPKTNLALLGNIRSGFFKGYSYTSAGNTFISNFMSPGYVLTSAGLDFKPSRMLSKRELCDPCFIGPKAVFNSFLVQQPFPDQFAHRCLFLFGDRFVSDGNRVQ